MRNRFRRRAGVIDICDFVWAEDGEGRAGKAFGRDVNLHVDLRQFKLSNPKVRRAYGFVGFSWGCVGLCGGFAGRAVHGSRPTAP